MAESSLSLEELRKTFLSMFRALNDSSSCLEDYNLIGETDNSYKKQTVVNVITDLTNKYKYIGGIKTTKIKFSQLYLTMMPVLLCLSRKMLKLISFTLTAS